MGAQGEGWPELDSAEWVRESWPARCVVRYGVAGTRRGTSPSTLWANRNHPIGTIGRPLASCGWC